MFRSFCVVCEKGGYAAAARELHLTGPALWEQIQGLERYYGVRLLERHGAGVRPTVHGRRLIGMIRPLLAGLDSTRGVLQQVDGALPEQLTPVTNWRPGESRGLRDGSGSVRRAAQRGGS
jgi:DNA-binding transcriptional LysR family regulator